MTNKVIFFLAALLLLQTSCKQSKTTNDARYLIVLSMDGFRKDYTEKSNTPNLDSIALIGVRAEGILPAFPSKTFPNHYTMATGLYPDHHGIVNNSFMDPATGLAYKMKDSAARLNPFFYGGEPIWVTASKAGLKTASFYWVGSELPIKDIQPDYWKKYDESVSFEDRIDTLIYWLKLPKKNRPQLIMCYFHEPDAIGHKFGPESNETILMVEYIDKLIGDLCRKINMLPYAKKIDLIFTSDHGMAQLSEDRVINMREIIPDEWLETTMGENPVFNVGAKQGYLDSVFNRLQKTEHVKSWKNSDMLERYHYGTNPRTLDITVEADLGWTINWRKSNNYLYAQGTHGYDPDYPEMHAVFYAVGPSFKKGYLHPAFDNVNLYVLMAEILGLEPAPNDGDLEKVINMLNR